MNTGNGKGRKLERVQEVGISTGKQKRYRNWNGYRNWTGDTKLEWIQEFEIDTGKWNRYKKEKWYR